MISLPSGLTEIMSIVTYREIDDDDVDKVGGSNNGRWNDFNDVDDDKVGDSNSGGWNDFNDVDVILRTAFIMVKIPNHELIITLIIMRYIME